MNLDPLSSPLSATRRAFLRTALAASLGSNAALGARSPIKGGKKGLCIVGKSPLRTPMLKKLKPDWTYSWGPNKPKNSPAGVDFVPMIWGYWGDAKSLRKSANTAKEAGIKNLLGFNEPDKKNQSNISVEKALRTWPLLEESGLRLGSPGCVQPDGEWMREFMAGVAKKGLRVDFICIHSYGGPNSKAFLQRLEKIRKMYRKPLWITEFAVGDWNAKSPKQNKHRPDKVLKFMEEVFPALDKLDYVEKHAWFPASPNSNPLGTSALFDKKGNLTKLGEFYRDFKSA